MWRPNKARKNTLCGKKPCVREKKGKSVGEKKIEVKENQKKKEKEAREALENIRDLNFLCVRVR